jgi:hypothetical protein
MTWDEYTIESPSFNPTPGSLSGTMIRLPAKTWAHAILDVNPAEAAGGDGEVTKTESGMWQEGIVFSGDFSDVTVKDTASWSPTIVDGVSRTALACAEELRDLLLRTKRPLAPSTTNGWPQESASGNWHNDGAPARAPGLCRVRLGYKWSGGVGGAKVPYYVYGYVRRIDVGPNEAGQKASGKMTFRLDFGYAQVEQG